MGTFSKLNLNANDQCNHVRLDRRFIGYDWRGCYGIIKKTVKIRDFPFNVIKAGAGIVKATIGTL